jgi:hypothetical protein
LLLSNARLSPADTDACSDAVAAVSKLKAAALANVTAEMS